MITRVFLLVLTLSLTFAAAQPTPEQAERIDHLQHRILAPCCWQEAVSEHRSEVSLEIREEIAQMVVAGKTDREILDRYKAEYGMRVLVEPEGDLFVIMNVVPVVFLILGGIIVLFILRNWLKNRPAAEQSA